MPVTHAIYNLEPLLCFGAPAVYDQCRVYHIGHKETYLLTMAWHPSRGLVLSSPPAMTSSGVVALLYSGAEAVAIVRQSDM
jgi:hypothetical protein